MRVKFPHSPILYYAFSSWIEKTMTKQYIAIRKTDLFYSSMGLCGNFTKFAKKINLLFLSMYWKHGELYTCLYHHDLSIHELFDLLEKYLTIFCKSHRKWVKFPHSPILLYNKSVFLMEMYCFCHCFLYSRNECII